MRFFLLAVVSAFLLLVLEGCSYRSDYEPPRLSYDTKLIKGDRSISTFWWKEFGDDSLGEFISLALKESPDIKASLERINASRALFEEARGALSPNITVGVDGSNRHLLEGSGKDSESYSFNIKGNYELDLWGRLSAVKKSKEYDLLIQKESLRDAALKLSIEIGKNWYLLAYENEKLALLQRELSVNEDIIRAMNIRFLNALANATDIFRQNQQIEALKIQIEGSKAKIESYKKSLLLLAGLDPSGSFDYSPKIIDKKYSDIAISSDLLNNRPDVRAALLTLYSKDSLLASKALDLYPKFTIGGSVLSSASAWANMFTDWFLDIFGSAVMTLFDGGAKLSSKEAARANLNEAEYLYIKSLLKAIKEVEDYYQKAEKQERIISLQERRYLYGKRSYESSLERYLYGDGTYIDLLQSQNSLLNTEIDLLSARSDMLQYSLELIGSLGMGASADMMITEIKR